MEILQNIEKQSKRLTIIGLVGIGLAGCAGAITIDENTVLYLSPNPIKATQLHEAKHREQMEQIGGSSIFWERYFNEPGFDCKSEIDAGVNPNDHFACKDDNWQSWTKEEISNTFKKTQNDR